MAGNSAKNLREWDLAFEISLRKALGWNHSTIECVAIEFRPKGLSRRRLSMGESRPRPPGLEATERRMLAGSAACAHGKREGAVLC